MKRLLSAGLLAGLIVNLVDVPNSAIVVSPRWIAFLAAHDIALNVPLVSAFYTTLHFLYGIGIAWAYVIAKDRWGGGTKTALASTSFLLLLHRAFDRRRDAFDVLHAPGNPPDRVDRRGGGGLNSADLT